MEIYACINGNTHGIRASILDVLYIDTIHRGIEYHGDHFTYIVIVPNLQFKISNIIEDISFQFSY